MFWFYTWEFFSDLKQQLRFWLLSRRILLSLNLIIICLCFILFQSFHLLQIFFFNFTGIFLFSSPSVDYHFSPLMYWSKQAHICATACTRVHVCVCVCLETVRKESWYTHIRNQHPKIKFRKYFFLWKIKMIFHHNRSYK